jgi:hypothetical protein
MAVGGKVEEKRPVQPSARSRIESMARRVGIIITALASFGCLVAQTERDNHLWAPPLPFLLVLLLVAGVVFLLCTGLVMFADTRWRRRQLVKILVALVAGSACGAFWVLVVHTAFGATMPGASTGRTLLGVGAVTGLLAAALLMLPRRLGQVVGLALISIGFHSFLLPIAALVSYLEVGTLESPARTMRPLFSAVILGIRLTGDLLTAGLGAAGLIAGLLLVLAGDGVLRRSRRAGVRARFDLSGPHA